MSAILGILHEKLSDQGIPEKAIPAVTEAIAAWLDTLQTDEAVRAQVRETTLGEYDTPLAAYWSKNTLVGLHGMVKAGR